MIILMSYCLFKSAALFESDGSKTLPAAQDMYTKSMHNTKIDVRILIKL